MTLTQEFETFFFILFVSACIMLGLAVVRNNQFQYAPVVGPLPSFVTKNSVPTAAPITSSPVAKTTTSSWPSPDGTAQVTLKTTTNTNLSTTYGVTVAGSTGKQTMIYAKTIPGISSMTIPFNAFSPDNQYVFLKQTIGDNAHYLVFKSSGEAFSDGSYAIDVVAAFANYTSDVRLTDVTGWAADTLLVINTKKPDGTLGPSFWYDVENHSFTQLSTLFQ